MIGRRVRSSDCANSLGGDREDRVRGGIFAGSDFVLLSNELTSLVVARDQYPSEFIKFN